MKIYLMLDVGGTNIKAGILTGDGFLINNEILSFDAKARSSREEIFQNFAGVLDILLEKYVQENVQIEGIGMAFPGPFDYKQGISLMQGLDKYDSIYGIRIVEELEKYFPAVKNGALFSGNSNYVFLHDVEAFAIGECFFGSGKNCERVIYLCIGTGAGSAFTEHKKILKGKDGKVPPMGWIFNTPFKEGIIDDYLSVRGLAALSWKAFGESKSGKELFRLCGEGNIAAIGVYEEFGGWLKEAMLPFLESFQPDGFVIGGQISKSFPFYGTEFASECRKRKIKIYLTEDTSRRTLEGLYAKMCKLVSV